MADLLADSLFWVMTIMLVLLFCCGLGLLLAPSLMQRLGRYLDRWYSVRSWLGPVDRPHYAEPAFYRHHRLIGLLLVAAAGYTLLRLPTPRLDLARSLLPTGWPQPLAELLLAALPAMLLIGNVLALVLGVIIYFRPSLIRLLETGANRWVSLRRTLKPMDLPHLGVDRVLWQHPRLVGLVLVLGCIYIGAMLLLFL